MDRHALAARFRCRCHGLCPAHLQAAVRTLPESSGNKFKSSACAVIGIGENSCGGVKLASGDQRHYVALSQFDRDLWLSIRCTGPSVFVLELEHYGIMIARITSRRSAPLSVSQRTSAASPEYRASTASPVVCSQVVRAGGADLLDGPRAVHELVQRFNAELNRASRNADSASGREC